MWMVNYFPFLLLMSVLHVKASSVKMHSSPSVIPSPEFLEAFALQFQKEGIMIALPEVMSNWLVLSQIKHFRYKRIFKQTVSHNAVIELFSVN